MVSVADDETLFTRANALVAGILSLLYYRNARLLFFEPRKTKHSWISLVYITAIFVAATVGIASYIKILDLTLVDHRGVIQKAAVLSYLPPFTTAIPAFSSFMVIIWLQDGLLVSF